MAHAMNNMATFVVAQTSAKNLQDLEKENKKFMLQNQEEMQISAITILLSLKGM